MNEIKGSFSAEIDYENTVNNSTPFGHDEYNRCFEYYKVAIEGRNEHYQSYNHWMNLYAVFTTAIFIGFYQVSSNEMLTSVFVFAGMFLSLCWMQSIRGYYHWIKSWIKCVQNYEEKLNELSCGRNDYYVYKFFDQKCSMCWSSKNLSTQKITVLFTFVLQIIWLVIGWNYIEDMGIKLFLIMGYLISFVILSQFSSNVSSMESDICKPKENKK